MNDISSQLPRSPPTLHLYICPKANHTHHPLCPPPIGLANKDELAAGIPLKRFGTADEVADAAAFLAKNSYANNCILNLDGGLSAA